MHFCRAKNISAEAKRRHWLPNQTVTMLQCATDMPSSEHILQYTHHHQWHACWLLFKAFGSTLVCADSAQGKYCTTVSLLAFPTQLCRRLCCRVAWPSWRPGSTVRAPQGRTRP